MVGFSPSYRQKFLRRFTVTESLQSFASRFCWKPVCTACIANTADKCLVCLCVNIIMAQMDPHTTNIKNNNNNKKKLISVGTRNDSFYDNQKCLWIKWLYIYHEASHNFILTWKVYMCKLVYCQEWNWFTMLKVGLNTEPVIREL